MKKLWFKRKTYGWGWTPATWEGWAVLLGFFILIGLNYWRLFDPSNEADFLVYFLPQTWLLLLILILVCYKTGEKPRWQWGETKEK